MILLAQGILPGDFRIQDACGHDVVLVGIGKGPALVIEDHVGFFTAKLLVQVFMGPVENMDGYFRIQG